MVEREPDLAQAFGVHRAAKRIPIIGVKQQEAAATRAHQLAADGAILAANFIPAIDAGVRGARRTLPFVQPMFVHQLAKTPRVTGFQRLLDALAKLLGEMQVVQHRRIAQLGPDFLVVQHGRGVARIAREEHEQVLFQVVQCAVADIERADMDLPVFSKLEAGQAPEGRDVLILLAHRLLQQIDLDPAGFLGHHTGVDIFALQSVNRPQQADRERARGAETGTGRNVRHADHFERRRHFVHTQHFANQSVADVVQRGGLLQSGILQEISAAEGLIQADVDVLVDGC